MTRLQSDGLERLWPMVWNAVGFLVKNGPVTPQDRWKEDPGYSPFTLATADLVFLNREAQIGVYLRETADIWHSNIEPWIYPTDTDLAHQIGVDGYCVRVSPPEASDAVRPQKI